MLFHYIYLLLLLSTYLLVHVLPFHWKIFRFRKVYILWRYGFVPHGCNSFSRKTATNEKRSKDLIWSIASSTLLSFSDRAVSVLSLSRGKNLSAQTEASVLKYWTFSQSTGLTWNLKESETRILINLRFVKLIHCPTGQKHMNWSTSTGHQWKQNQFHEESFCLLICGLGETGIRE